MSKEKTKAEVKTRKLADSKIKVYSRSKRGVPLNKNGAIIRNAMGDKIHLQVLGEELVGQRSPKKQKFSNAQEQAHNRNIEKALSFNTRYPKGISKFRK